MTGEIPSLVEGRGAERWALCEGDPPAAHRRVIGPAQRSLERDGIGHDVSVCNTRVNRSGRPFVSRSVRRSVALALLLAAGLALTQPVAWMVALDGPTAHAAELEIDVTGPGGIPPAKGTAAFFPYGIDSSMGRLEAPLDARGRCVLWPRPGDSGVVLVQADGFRTWWSYDVQVAPGRQRLRVELDEGLAVSGLVLGRDGATPVADASVRVTEHALRGLAPNLAERKTRTDGEGRFSVEGLSPGRVDIHVASDDGSGSATADAGDRDVRIRTSRTIRVRLLPIDATTGLGPATESLEIVQTWYGQLRTRWFRAGHRMPPAEDRTALPREGLPVWGHEPARFRVIAAGYAPSDEIVVSPDDGPEEQVVRVPLTPDPGSVATLRLHVGTVEGTVPPVVYVTVRSTDRLRSAGKRRRTEDGVVELRLPPGPAALIVEVPSPCLEEPWLPAHVAVDLPRSSVVDEQVVLPSAGFVRVSGVPEHSGLPCAVHAQQLSDLDDPYREPEGDFPVLGWDWDAATRTHLSRPVPPGEYATRWVVDGRARVLRFVVRPGEVSDARVTAE